MEDLERRDRIHLRWWKSSQYDERLCAQELEVEEIIWRLRLRSENL